MNKNLKILLLNLPSSPNQQLWRDTAGGFGSSFFCPPNFKIRGETSLHPFLPYASSILLKEGYEFKIVDCQRLQLYNRQAVEAVKKENPDVIFSIISLPSMKNDLKILDEIKELIPNVKTVGVGTVCCVLPEEILLRSKMDVVLRNDYPYITNMVDLIRALQQSKDLKTVKGVSFIKNKQIVSTPDSVETDFNNLPTPCYDFIPLDGYATFRDKMGKRFSCIVILDSKGCPYNCTYCPYPLGFGRKYTYKPTKLVADEIEELYTSLNIRVFDFRSQAFAYNRKRALEICKELMKRKLDIGWLCESRVDEVNRELLETMKKAGCQRIHYGVETGNPKILKIAKPGVTLETTKKTFKTTKKTGMLTQAHIILGWPDDDHKTLENTRKFILKLEPDVINLNFLTPYPGTKMYEIAKKNSLILTYDWSNYTSYKVVMRTKTLKANELYAIKKKIIRDFSKQKLKHLLQHDFTTINKPQLFINKARSLVNKILVPHD